MVRNVDAPAIGLLTSRIVLRAHDLPEANGIFGPSFSLVIFPNKEMHMTQPPIDNAIVDPKLYADEKAFHALFSMLRREQPVRWTEPDAYRPFWTVSKHADIIEIERQNEKFINDPRTILLPIEQEEAIKQFTGGSHLLLRTLVHMDNPDHKVMRGLTQSWFLPPNLRGLQQRLADLAKDHVDKLEALGGNADFVGEVAVWFPLSVIMMILGVPSEDQPLMLKLTKELLGSTDPDMQREAGKVDMTATVTEFDAYFKKLGEEKRKHPSDDLASVIANAHIDGKPIGDLEALSYYIITATAGHETTTASIAGGLLALLQHPEQLAKLRANPDLLPTAVEEMLRWVSPVKNFMRNATEDYVLRGQQIKAGDALLMCYWSANRDEEIFQEPFHFDIARSPNRHLAFGHGAHMCLGQHLAKMEMRALYTELLSRIDELALDGKPAWAEANVTSGLKQLPIRYSFAKRAG